MLQAPAQIHLCFFKIYRTRMCSLLELYWADHNYSLIERINWRDHKFKHGNPSAQWFGINGFQIVFCVRFHSHYLGQLEVWFSGTPKDFCTLESFHQADIFKVADKLAIARFEVQSHNQNSSDLTTWPCISLPKRDTLV